MPKEKGSPNKRTEEQKEKAIMVAKRRLAAYQKSLRQPQKKKPQKKRSLLSKFSFVELSRKIFGGKKNRFTTRSTKHTERQLQRGLAERDIRRLRDKGGKN